jgi:tetratricopeptide (TPR) repeat protein
MDLKKINIESLRIICLSLLLLIVVSCKSQSAIEYYKWGAFYDTIGQPKKAFKYFTKAIKKDPTNPYYYVRRANIRIGVNFKKATLEKDVFADLNIALSIEPNNYYALYWRAFWLYKFIPELHDVEKAIVELEALAKLYPTKADTYWLLGEICIRNDTAIAYKSYKTLLELVSNKSKVYNEMADFEYINGYHQQAINHYRLVDTLTSYSSNNLAYCYWMTNKKDSACGFYIEDNEPKLEKEYKDLIEYCKSKK